MLMMMVPVAPLTTGQGSQGSGRHGIGTDGKPRSPSSVASSDGARLPIHSVCSGAVNAEQLRADASEAALDALLGAASTATAGPAGPAGPAGTDARSGKLVFASAPVQAAHQGAATALATQLPAASLLLALDASLQGVQAALQAQRRGSGKRQAFPASAVGASHDSAAARSAAGGPGSSRAGAASASSAPPDASSDVDTAVVERGMAAALDAAAQQARRALSAALSPAALEALIEEAGDACAAFADVWDAAALEAEADLPDSAAAPLDGRSLPCRVRATLALQLRNPSESYTQGRQEVAPLAT